MIQMVTVFHIVICVFLIILILAQQGKKDGMGSAFGGGGNQASTVVRGADTFLEKATKILAFGFMATSLSLVYLTSKASQSSLFSSEKNAPVKAAPAVSGTTAPVAAPAAETTPESAANPSAAPIQNKIEDAKDATQDVSKTVEKTGDAASKALENSQTPVKK